MELINKKETFKREENPFENEQISQEWIRSVEGEKGMLRDMEIYPRLKNWVKQVSPDMLVEIGSGQGICAEKCEINYGKYIGVEPSIPLVKRARELYASKQREFLIGSAYELPISSESVDAGFSVNVWFHLENPELASKELNRILRPGGKFLIITANPDATELWESWYSDTIKEGKKLVGKISIPINPLSKNTFYQHTLKEIIEALGNSNLEVERTESFGQIDGKSVFLQIQGKKRIS